MRPIRKGLRGQRGLAMVEFAIALPLLLLLLLGVAEFGRMLFHYNSLLQASRDAARFAASNVWNATLGQLKMEGGSQTEINNALQAQVKNVAVYGVPSALAGLKPAVPNLNVGQVTVSPMPLVGETPSTSSYVRVSIAYPFQPVLSVLPTFYGDAIPLSVTLNASIVMRVL